MSFGDSYLIPSAVIQSIKTQGGAWLVPPRGLRARCAGALSLAAKWVIQEPQGLTFFALLSFALTWCLSLTFSVLPSHHLFLPIL